MIPKLICAGLVVLASLGLSHANTESAGAASSSSNAQDDQEAESTLPYWERDVWADPNRGFNWYPPDKAPAKPGKKVEAKPRKSLKEITDAEELKAEVERLRGLAVMNPTRESVLAYLRANAYILEKSSTFADVAKRVIWTNPDVDYTSKNSMATYASTNERQRHTERIKQTALRIGESHGLVFFFRSDCGYCHDMAPVVKSVADNYGITVLPISMDGGPMPAFPNARPDNGISLKVSHGEGVQAVPALYLVSKDKREITLLGTGALAANEIVERIHVLTQDNERGGK